MMNVEVEGIPYADCFSVVIRWVARREADRDLRIDVGVEVNFKKSTFLKSKIRAGTIEETAPVHKDLFQAASRACANAIRGGAGEEVEQESDEDVATPGIDESDTKTISQLHDLSSDSYIYTISLCGALLLLLFLWRFLRREPGIDDVVELSASTILAEEIATLGSRIDSLEVEIKAFRSTLEEVLLVLNSKSI